MASTTKASATKPASWVIKNTKVNLEDVKRPLDLSQVAQGWHSPNKEYDYWVPQVDIEGKIPPQLRGTLLRNGPGLLEIYGKKLQHCKQGT